MPPLTGSHLHRRQDRFCASTRRLALAVAVLVTPVLADAPAPAPGPCGPARLFVPPTDDRLRFTGRWLRPADAEPSVSWAGASVWLRFRGTEAIVDLDTGAAPEQFRVVVDGEARDEVLVAGPGRGRQVLVGNLEADRVHTVQLVKETYAADQTTLHGFELRACEVLQAPAPSPRRVAFFGDSNMDGTSLYDEKDGGDSGAWFAYPSTAGRMLEAEVSVQAYGGATLTEQPDNNVLDFITAQRRDRSDPAYRDGFDPQVIVVNAGANDIFQITGPDQEARIEARFRTVIARLREVYGPRPHIMLYNAYGWHPDEPANLTEAVVSEVGGNLSAVHYPWIWEQFHGAMAEHGGQARYLAETIAQRVPGFEVLHPLDTIDGWGRNFDVANGGFEHAARSHFKGFGWRYADDGVERIFAPESAFEGAYFIRLEAGEQVHQGTEATGDFLPGPTEHGQRYRVTARVRAAQGARQATARLQADFEAQTLYDRDNAVSETFVVGQAWTEISAVFTAPAGTWTTYITLAAETGIVDFDAVRMDDPDRRAPVSPGIVGE
jgi:lysophospholipase L1-like esterase